MLAARMMRCAVVALALIAGLPAAAAAQCFAVTPSGRAAFVRLLSPAEQCAARREGRRRRCADRTVAEGTAGAIDGAIAQQLVPHLRGELARHLPACRKTVGRSERKVSPRRDTARARAKAKVQHVAPAPLPVAKPVTAATQSEMPVAPPQAPSSLAALPDLPAADAPQAPAARPRGFLAWLAALLGW